MSSTFTVPMRLNTRQTTSNDGTISADTTGASQISKQVAIVGGAAATAVIPAGSIISNVKLYETTAPSALTAGVITVAVDGTTIGTITPTDTVGGVIDIAFTATAAAAALIANNGSVDSTITFTWARSAITGTLAGTFSVEYTARNIDGSIINVGQGYTNS